MIHYHGLPITPDTAAISAVKGGHAFVSFAHNEQLGLAAEHCQSFACDNGAFSAWKSGKPITDWTPYFEWIDEVSRYPNFDFAVIPDVIDGDENSQIASVAQFTEYFHAPRCFRIGAPVWHMHESIDRLKYLAHAWPRICIGSSGEFATVGVSKWWIRIAEAMNAICDSDGFPKCKVHGLRMLDPDVFTRLPFASADSTNIARNIGIDSAWRGTYTPPTKNVRAMVMRERIESQQSAMRWTAQQIQMELAAQCQ